MMEYWLKASFDDSRVADPGHIVKVPDVDALLDYIREELCNDYGNPFGPTFTLVITRIS